LVSNNVGGNYMKRIVVLGFVMVIGIVLVSCEQQTTIVKEFTFELVGEDTVRIEEGLEYIEQGVMIDGEAVKGISFQSNVDTSRVGTYYVEFFYEGKTLMRTVIVTEGAKTDYNAMLKELEEALSYSYSFQLDVSFDKNSQEIEYYKFEDFDVYGDYLHGQWGTNLFGDEIIRNQYIYINRMDGVKEKYEYDQYSNWYMESNYYETTNTLITEFTLDYFSYVTRQTVGDQDVYSVYLKSGAYDHAYYNSINYLDNQMIDQSIIDPLKILVYCENDHIVKIVADMSQLFNENIIEPSKISNISYIFTYEFTNINQIEPIVIPPEMLATKN